MALCPDLWDSMALLSMGLNTGYTSVHRTSIGMFISLSHNNVYPFLMSQWV